MLKPTWFWILLVVHAVSYGDVTALNCFECNDVFKPFLCDIVTQCTTGEECFIDQFVTSSGNLLYNSGCRSTQRCGVAKRELHQRDAITTDQSTNNGAVSEDQTSDILTCSQCCNNTDYCNLQGCGEAPLPRTSRGPLCFDCSKQGQNSCRHITQCDVHYSCEVTTEIVSNITLYNSHCVHTLSAAHCNATVQRSLPSLIGKRDQSSADYCPKCCDDDFCNRDCTKRLDVNGGWSTWGTWGSCSATCGAGTQERIRTCTNPPSSTGVRSCIGVPVDTRQCTTNNTCPINGGYSGWLQWGQCDVTCGSSGTQVRTRLCNKPVPAFGGDGCKGDSADTRVCQQLPACVYPNGGYGDWAPWGACPYTCGSSGHQYRHRICLHSPCTGKDTDSKNCRHQTPCPVNGGFSLWGAWSACSNTCGKQGTHTRTRSCTNPAPAYNGKGCVGLDHDSHHCTLSSTAAEFSCLSASSSYTVWAAWSKCSVSCGSGGTRQRTKQCYDSAHHRNQSLCTQPLLEQTSCNITDCPKVNGGWSSWSRWSKCTSDCGQGYQSKHRSCTHPRPSGGGLSCSGGETTQRRVCDNTGTCNDAGYGPWSLWSTCSRSCGSSGLKSRTRACPHGRPGHGDCQGTIRERIPCNDDVTCGGKVDGGWGKWSHWTTCSSSCATGQHHRARACNHPAPQNGGHSCVGSQSEVGNCTSSCPVAACESVAGYHLYTYRTHVASSSRVTAYLCLHFSTSKHSWSRAARICHDEGGSMAAFDTWEENSEAFARHIHNAYPRVPYARLWIGLSHNHHGWQWEDGRHIGYYAQHKLGSNYTMVTTSFPRGACVVDDGTNWSLVDCSEMHYFMCERTVG